MVNTNTQVRPRDEPLMIWGGLRQRPGAEFFSLEMQQSPLTDHQIEMSKFSRNVGVGLFDLLTVTFKGQIVFDS